MTRLLALLAANAYADFGWRVPLLVGLMVLTGVLEGLAVTATLPLLSQFSSDETQGQSGAFLLATLAHAPVMLGLPEGPVGVGVLMVVLVAASALTFLAMAQFAARLQAQYMFGWQKSIFSAALRAGPAFLEARRGGDVVAAIVPDVNRVGSAFHHGCTVLAASVNLFIYVSLAFLVSPAASLSVVFLGIALFTVTRPLMRRAFSYGIEITRIQADIQTLSGEGVSNAKAIKVNVAEEKARERFDEAAEKLAEANYSNAFDAQKARAVFEFGGAAGVGSLLVVGPLLMGVEIAEVLVVLALFVRLLPRVMALQQGLHALSVLLPALDNVLRLREEAHAAAEPTDTRPLPSQIANAPTSIRFRGVRVARGDSCVLDGVELYLPAGSIAGLVGLSGSGKSTLVDAILGLVPLTSGSIEIGGVPLNDLPLPSWRRAIGYVSQETTLLSGSIRDNIRLGSEADPEAVKSAIERAAASFVWRLADGIDTPVGDRGSRLSGGERQRIGLARALVLPRRLLVLDEATSSLDAETEAEVLRTVAQAAGASTVLLVAHRFSAVRHADVIHVLENGRIVESGDWASLDRPGTRFHVLKQLQEMTQ